MDWGIISDSDTTTVILGNEKWSGACTEVDGTEIRKTCMYLIHRGNHNDDDDDGSYDDNNNDYEYYDNNNSFFRSCVHSFIHLRTFPLYPDFSSRKPKFLHTSQSLLSSLSPRLASLTPPIHISLGLPPVPHLGFSVAVYLLVFCSRVQTTPLPPF